MQFDLIIQENLRNALKLIRVKVDPIFSSYHNFKKVASYEGYFLEETPEIIKIMVSEPSLSVIDIPKLTIVSPQILEKFKHYILDQLNIPEEDSLFGQISNSTCLKDIEVFLKQSGHKDVDLINIYRNYIEHV